MSDVAETAETDVCQNCAAQLDGVYCHVCGQKAVDIRLPLRSLIDDLAHSVLHFDGRLATTLRSITCHPGEMTVDWIAGRRARHMPPIRLFVFMTLLLVVLFSVADVALVEVRGRALYNARIVAGNSRVFEVDKTRSNIRIDPLVIARPHAATEQVFGDELVREMRRTVADPSEGAVLRNAVQTVNAFAADPRGAGIAAAGALGRFALVAVPLMALTLKLLLRRRRYLVEHLVFSLNEHLFLVLLFLVGVLLVWVTRGLVGGWWLLAALWAVYSLHFLLAMKRVYGQGWIRTLLKSAVVTGFYLIGLSVVAGVYASYSLGDVAAANATNAS